MKLTNTILSKLFASVILLLSTAFMTSAMAEEEGNSAVGAKLWAETCNRCHNMRDPKEFSDEYWDTIVKHMRVRAGLTGQDSRDITAFLQSANTPIKPSKPSKKKQVLGDSGLSGDEVYNTTCVACHAANGKDSFPGVPDFTDKNGPLTKTDLELLDNIIMGFQTPGSAMAMPARGGNASLSDADIKAVLAYIRSSFGR